MLEAVRSARMKNQYPNWMRKAARKGGKAKSAAKTAAARKANAARWRNHKPKRASREEDESKITCGNAILAETEPSNASA